MRLRIVLAVAALGVLAVACGNSRAAERPRSTAKLSVVTPAPGEMYEAGAVRVRLTLTGARIIPGTKFELAPDEGHIHLRLDGEIVSMTYGVEQVVKVAKGPHLLEAEFVAGDHLPFDPRVIVAVTFTAR